MRVAIVEDELPALEHLEVLLGRVAPDAEVVARLRTVRETRAWLATGQADLVVADIQLGDGLSLDAFAEVERDVPVVFTTAYDHHLAPALAGNGIAYLLKPLREAELAAAVAKLRRLERHFAGSLSQLARRLGGRAERLVGRRGVDWVGVDVADVAWIRVRHGITVARVRSGPEVMLEEPLEALQARLDPARFHRANRWYLVALDAVARVRGEGRGRLVLVLDPPADDEVVVPQPQAAAFRAWFGM